MASVNRIPVTDSGTQTAFTVNSDPNVSNPVQKDKKGTPPVRLDPTQTYRLRYLFLTSAYLRLANDEMKNMLFTHPFDVFMGTSKQNELKQSFKESVVQEYWLPALKEIHDWLLQFGLAPYRIVPVLLPIVAPHFDIASFRKANLSSKKEARPGENNGGNKEKETPDDNNEEKEEEDGNKKKSSPKTPTVMKASEKAKDENSSSSSSSSSSAKKSSLLYTARGEELHYVIDIPDHDSGYISTYVDRHGKQRFLWTWYPSAVPQTFDNSDGYTDETVQFVVKDAPTIRGDYTNPLRTLINEWLYVNTRKKMDTLSMRDRLNPLLFIEEKETNSTKPPSVIDEMAVNYSAAMNAGNLNAMAGDGRPTQMGRTDPMNGQLSLGYGQTVKYDVTRIDGLADVGLNTYYYGSSEDGTRRPFRTEGPDYATLVSTLEFNRRGPRQGRIPSASSPFGFGGINDDELTTNLCGMMGASEKDPNLVNSMSGVSYRTKHLEKGQTAVIPQRNELDAYVNATSIEQQERILEESLCYLAGFPATFITGRSGSGKMGAGGKSSSSGSNKGSSSSYSAGSAGGTGAVATGADGDNSKSFLVKKVRHYKAFYEHRIMKMFLQCYGESLAKSKAKLLRELDETYWFILENVYEFRAELPVDPPPTDSASMMNGFGAGMVTLEEVVRATRINLGLSLDVMDDPVFMEQARKKLENKCDPEAQMKLQQKYATKPEGKGGSAKAPKGKKRKAENNASSGREKKKPKKQ